MLVSGEDQALTHGVLKNIFDELGKKFKSERNCVAYFSAMKSPVKRISNKYRVQILMRIVRDYDRITQTVYEAADRHAVPKVSVFVEINPNNLS